MANEVRLIDANVVYEKGHRTPFHIGIADLCDLKELLGDVPTIAPESLRPKGRWVYDEGNLEWACSECLRAAHVNLGAISGYILSDFCPNCGADMREGGE